jgi:hypothetical protein
LTSSRAVSAGEQDKRSEKQWTERTKEGMISSPGGREEELVRERCNQLQLEDPTRALPTERNRFIRRFSSEVAPSSPDLPVPAAAPSAWKSWDLPLMLNHFLTRLLDHDSCKKNRISTAFSRLTDRSWCCRGLSRLGHLALLAGAAAAISHCSEQSRGALMQPEGPSEQWRLSALLNSGCKRWPARQGEAMVGRGWSRKRQRQAGHCWSFCAQRLRFDGKARGEG